MKNFVVEAGRVMFTLSEDDKIDRRSSIISRTNNQSFCVKRNSQSEFTKLNSQKNTYSLSNVFALDGKDMSPLLHNNSSLFQKRSQPTGTNMNLQRFESKLAKLHMT